METSSDNLATKSGLPPIENSSDPSKTISSLDQVDMDTNLTHRRSTGSTILHQPSMESIEDHRDKGWAWVVALAACICNFILIGSGKGMGVILNAVVEKFEYPAAYSILMFISVGATMPCTVISSHLTNYVSCRILVHIGGGLVCLGTLLTAFAVNIYMVFAGLGLCAGIGGGFVIPATYVIINQYFSEKRSKGLAMATVGGGLGSFAFSPIMGALFDYYGYQGALMVIASLYLNLQVAAALMRPPPKIKTGVKEIQDGGAKPEVPQNGGDHVTQNGGKHVTQHGGKHVTQHGGQETEVDGGLLKPTYDEESHLLKKNEKENETPFKRSRLELLKNGTFFLYLFNVSTCLLPVTMIYIPAFGLEIGIPTTTSAWILSLNGLSDIFGRVVSGFLFDKIKHGQKRIVHAIIGIIIGIFTLSIGFISTLVSLCIFAFIVGFFEAMFNAQRTAVPFEFVAKESMANALGLIFLAEYIGTLLGPVMHGTLNGKYGTYTIGYIIGGSLFAFTSIIMCMDYIRVKYFNRRSF